MRYLRAVSLVRQSSRPDDADQEPVGFDRRSSPPTERVIDVLELFAGHPEAAFATTEVANRLGMSRTTCHQILSVLTERRWLSRNPATRRFTLGLAALELRYAAEHPSLLITRALNELGRVHAELGVSLALSARTGNELVTIAVLAETGQLDQGSTVGSRVPFAPPFGAALVAWFGQTEIDEWLRRAPNLETRTVSGLRNNLGKIRANGYGISGLSTAPTQWLSLAIEELTDRPDERHLRDTLGTLLSELALSGSREPNDSVRTIMAPVFDKNALPRIVATLFRPVNGPPAAQCIERLLDATRAASLCVPESM